MEVTITTLEEVSSLSNLRSPSLIVVGKSVELRDKLWKFR